MKKHICDLCGGDLIVVCNAPPPFSSIWWRHFKFGKRTMEKISFFDIPSIFSRPVDFYMEICSKCFDDFEEFIRRKNSYKKADQ